MYHSPFFFRATGDKKPVQELRTAKSRTSILTGVCIAVMLMTIGIMSCLNAVFVIAPRTNGVLVETLIAALGLLFLYIGWLAAIESYRSWRDNPEHMQSAKRNMRLASVIRRVNQAQKPLRFKE